MRSRTSETQRGLFLGPPHLISLHFEVASLTPLTHAAPGCLSAEKILLFLFVSGRIIGAEKEREQSQRRWMLARR